MIRMNQSNLEYSNLRSYGWFPPTKSLDTNEKNRSRSGCEPCRNWTRAYYESQKRCFRQKIIVRTQQHLIRSEQGTKFPRASAVQLCLALYFLSIEFYKDIIVAHTNTIENSQKFFSPLQVCKQVVILSRHTNTSKEIMGKYLVLLELYLKHQTLLMRETATHRNCVD